MSISQSNKNSSQDFILKKEFIDLQIELRKFLDETSLFTLQDLIKDPLVVHGLEDYINAYLEANEVKKTKKTLKKLLKFKKKNTNLTPFLQELQENSNVQESPQQKLPKKIHFSENFEFQNSLFGLKAVKPIKEPSKEKMLQVFKNSIARLENLRKITISKPLVSRNFVVSSSHSNLLKKIEKSGEAPAKNVSQKMGNEITATTSFRNGILKNNAGAEKSTMPPTSPQSNVVKATRSPYQSLTSGNTPESSAPPKPNDNVETNDK